MTFTEVAFEPREKVLRAVEGWGAVFGDLSTRDDSGLIFDKKVWVKVEGYTKIVLAPMFWKENGEKVEPTGAAFAVLQHKDTGKKLLVTVMHLPASVEGPGGLTGLPNRVAAWREGQKNWKREWNRLAKKHHVDGVLVVADWNVNIKRKIFLPLFSAVQKGMKLVFNHNKVPVQGTHHKRWIDFSFVRGNLKVRNNPWLLPDDNSSDHRPYAETLVWA